MSLGCMSENGDPVDGWTILKKNSGYQYFIYNAATTSFELSSYELNQVTDGAIMRTLAPLYDVSLNSSYAYLFYNDNPPVTGANSYYAHAKGILASDANSGFWMVHSMPNWPYAPSGSEGANDPGIISDDTYAQSYRCVSAGISEINTIAGGLRIDDPKIYGGIIPTALAPYLDQLQLLLDGEQNSDDLSEMITFASSAGTTYYQAAKSKKWDKDLWDDMIAPYFQTPMNVETWVKGSGGRQSSICNNSDARNTTTKEQPYNIYQVSVVNMPNGDSWTVLQDHSKYGFSVQSEDTTTCVGDINRMCSQERRGGGALCLADAGLHKAFQAIAYDVEACYGYEDPCISNNCYYCDYTMTPTSIPTYKPTTGAASSNDAVSAGEVIGLSCGAIVLVMFVIGALYSRRRHFRFKPELERRLSVGEKGNIRSSLDGSGPTFGEYQPPANPRGSVGNKLDNSQTFIGSVTKNPISSAFL